MRGSLDPGVAHERTPSKVFRGLFIGIDRYASADINWLSCAAATPLHFTRSSATRL